MDDNLAEDFNEYLNQRAKRITAEAAETPQQRQQRLTTEFTHAIENHF